MDGPSAIRSGSGSALRGGALAESFETDDVGAAQAYVQRVYPKAELRDSKHGLRFQQATWSQGGVGFTRFRFDSWMDIAVEFEQVAAFGLVLGGDYAAHSNRVPLQTGRPFLFTPGWGGSRSEHLDLLMVNVGLDVLGSAASGGAVEPGAPVFRGTGPTSRHLEAHWMRTLRYAWSSVVQVEALFRNDLIRTATFDAVLAAAVAAFPITAEAPRADPLQQAVIGRAVRRAREFVDAHAGSAITVQQIADAAGVSVRTLQLGFRRDLDLTPLQYLRLRRLDAARTALLAADPDGLAIGDLARRLGWTNAGRFTAHYRAQFGEPPSTTLRR